MSIDKLTLISGIDIPIPELQVNIHQPTIKEIAYIGEKSFYKAAQLLTIETQSFLEGLDIPQEEYDQLKTKSNFEIFLMVVGGEGLENAMLKVDVIRLFSLLFPSMIVNIEERFVMLTNPNPDKKQSIVLDDNKFEVLQSIVTTILCLHSGTAKEEFNPVGKRAREIVEKIKKARAKVAKEKGLNNKESSFLSKYISGLGIGTNSLTIKDTLELTLYQLLNQIERYGLYNQYNMSIQAKMAGAKDVEDIDWLKDIENN